MKSFPPIRYFLLSIVLCLFFSSYTVAQDFKVQHIQDDVDNSASSTSTLTDDVSSLEYAFAIPANNKKTHAGRSDSDNNTLNGDDMSGARVLTATNTLTYYRETGSIADAMNFHTTIWEYTGAVSGSNEFIVRGRYAIALDGGTTNVTTDITFPTNTNSLSAVVNADNCIPFITGIMNNDSGSGADSGTAIAYLTNTTTLEVKKGTKSNNVTVYVTLVEFTGTNWTVLHGTSGDDSNNTGTITLTNDSSGSGTATDVTSWNNAIIFTQSKADHSKSTGNVKEDINAQWPIMAPGSDTQSVDWTFDSGRSTSSSGPSANESNHFIHVLENSEIQVTRFTDTSSADDESTIDISSAALSSLDQSMIIGTSITSGTDTSYGRGWRNYYFNSTIEAAHWSHRSGNTMSHHIQIVNFAQPTGPGGITSNLELWLKADSGVEELNGDTAEDGDSVLNWLDSSTNLNDATQSTSLNRPTYNESGINFNPSITFDGTNHEMTASTSVNSQITIFAVTEGAYSSTKNLLNLDNGANGSINVEQTGTTTIQGRYSDGGPDSGVVSETIPSGPFIVQYRHDAGSTNALFVNGLGPATVSTDPDNLTGAFTTGIGADPTDSSTRWDGDIAELIIYNSKITGSNKRWIETYLAIKYGITLGVNGTSQSYKDSDDRKVWDIVVNSGYNYNVTGIGRDDASGLNQKQSKTVNTDDDITVGIKEIASTNSTNTTDFYADKTFLMWGHNNASTSAATDITKDFGAGTGYTTNLSVTPINRVWKMVVTDSVPTVKLSIPETMVSATNPGSEEYVMIIADDASFTTNLTSATMKDVGGDLEVDFYFEGTKFITFGSAPITSIGSSAVYFDNTGSNDMYLDAGDVNDLANSDFTISAWMKRDAWAEKFDIVSKRNYYDEYIHPTDSLLDESGYYTHGYAFRINQTGHFRMVWKDPEDTKNNQLQTKETIPVNEWHHIAATYDYSENYAVLYIDGIHVYDSDDFLADKGFPIDPLNTPSDSHFMIGAAHQIKRQQKMRGSVDEVRVWNVPLSGDQIRYVMNQEIEENAALNADGKLIPSSTTKNEIISIPWNNLIAYYPMSNAVFGSIKDESNSGNDASMINYNTIEEQTAPLPYKTTSGGTGSWDDPDSWVNGDIQYLPGVVSYLYEDEAVDTDKFTMDYNIVQIDHNITLDNSDTDLIPAYKNGNRTVLGMIVNTGADLEIVGDTDTNVGYGLTVSHYLKLDGTIDLEGESQLIQTEDSDLDETSNGSLERDQQGLSNLYLYNYWCSPVGFMNNTANNNAYRVTDIFDNIGFKTTGYDGSTGPDENADYWIWKYPNKPNNEYAQWQQVRSTGYISTGEGFTMKNTGTTDPYQNYVLLGKPNNGDFTLPLSTNSGYLIGNPYPSAMDADEFIKDNISDLETSGRNTNGNIISGVLYFWDHFAVNSHYLADYDGGYGTYTLMGGVRAINNDARIGASGNTGTKVPQRYIPVGQGFFVTSSLDNNLVGEPNDPDLSESIDGGLIVFKNSQRVFEKEGSESVFFRPENSADYEESEQEEIAQQNDTRSKIRLNYASPDGYHRELMVGVDPNASDGFDIGYDAPLNESNKEDMVWQSNSFRLVIQAVNNFDLKQVLPLYIRTHVSGVSRISLERLEHVSSETQIYARDLETGRVQNLREGDFEVFLEPGEFTDRFEIAFSTKSKTLSVDDLERDQIRAYFANDKKQFVIHNPNAVVINQINIYSILGQEVYSTKSKSSEQWIEHQLHRVKTGIYIVKMDTEFGVVNRKILIH